jgi:hypothetical protein
VTCEDGEAGLIDRRLGKTSGRRVPSDRAEEVERLYRERYQGFTVKHFHEHRVKDHGFGWGYTWLKLHLQWAGVVPKAPRKGAHRRKRERRPLPGMMLHQDGSRHEWLEGQALDLVVTLDDATGAIYSAFLIEEEGTASTFRALKEVFAEHGLPMSLYTDRGSHYFRTTKAGEIDLCLERTDLVRGRRQKLVDDGRVAVGQRLPARQAIADKAHQVRAIDELAVIGRVRRLDVRKIEDIHVFRGKPALIGFDVGSMAPNLASLPQTQRDIARALSSREAKSVNFGCGLPSSKCRFGKRRRRRRAQPGSRRRSSRE